MKDLQVLGYRIRNLREERGLDQKELAERSGITRTTLWQIEKGAETFPPQVETMIRLCRALGTTVEELYDF